MDINVISSPAKLKILRILLLTNSAINFRQLVRFSEVGVRSAQLALKDFIKYKIVSVKNEKNRKLFSIIDPKTIDLYKKLFEDTENKIIYSVQANLSIKPKRILPIIQDLYDSSMIIRQAVIKHEKQKTF